MFSFENLTVYQKAQEFSQFIYKLTNDWPRSELFGLTSQLRRAAVSVSLNLAEGSSRTKKEFIHFITIACGSAYECVPLINLAFERKLIEDDEYYKTRGYIIDLTKMLSGLRRALRK